MSKFEKGSEEAKEYMASIREKRVLKEPKEKNPKKARMTKGTEEAKEKMAKVRAAKQK